ncbi:MAG: hypothetical protein SNG38_01235 [Rikenellaceae bacterium]
MKQIIIFFFAVFSFGNIAYAENSADSILKEVLSNIEERNPYKVEIEVSYADNNLVGFYEVEDDKYYISIDKQELYGDANVKYEVFNSRKEVVIDRVKSDNNGNILNNPATAFSVIRDHYSATILSENEYYTVIELKPNLGDENSVETIELAVSNDEKLPIEIIYRFGDDMVRIKVVQITPLQSTITSYSPDKYVDYEVIDFR